MTWGPEHHVTEACDAGLRERGCSTVPQPGVYLFPCSPWCECRSLRVELRHVEVRAGLVVDFDGAVRVGGETVLHCEVHGKLVELSLPYFRARVRGVERLSLRDREPLASEVLA